MAKAETLSSKYQFISVLPLSPKKPINDFAAIITREVPTASFIGNFDKITKAGMIKKPPPAPTNCNQNSNQRALKQDNRMIEFLFGTDLLGVLFILFDHAVRCSDHQHCEKQHQKYTLRDHKTAHSERPFGMAATM